MTFEVSMTCMNPALFISSVYDMPPDSSESYLNKSLYPSVTPSSSIIKENPSSFKTFSLLQYLSNFLLRNSFSVKQEKILSTNSTLKLDVFKSMYQVKSTPFQIYYSQNQAITLIRSLNYNYWASGSCHVIQLLKFCYSYC